MKKNRSLILSIVAVTAIIALVIGGTYAYWQWQSANNTVVSFTVSGGTMTIDGGGDINGTKVLAPAQCTNTTYAIQRKVQVTATNETTTAMTGVVGLHIDALTAAQGTLNATNKAFIKYALVTTNQTQYEATGFSKTADACATSATAQGNFGSLSTGDDIALLSGLTVPAKSGNTNGSFTGYYELYIWIDKTYGDNPDSNAVVPGYGATGTTIIDPLQDLTLNLSWTGSMTNET